jgi:hypothetical protein
MGGGKLAASFHAEQLISRYNDLSISSSPRLRHSAFRAHSTPPDTLQFRTAKPFPSGIVVLTYDHAQSA